MFALLGAIYLFGLDRAPVYFGGDEAHFAVGAHAIATTGKNLKGDRLPLFVNLADPLGGKVQSWGDTWYQPLLFYLNAFVLMFAPLSAAVIRAPMAIIGGILSPWLLYLVARRLIGQPWPALIAALVLALAPVQLVLSRQALDYVLPIPFVLAWLWCLFEYLRTRRNLLAGLLGLTLGIGCYSYIASWAMMPLYLLVSWMVFIRAGCGIRPVVTSAIAFAAPVLLAPIWIAFHHEMLTQTLARYGETDQPKAGFVRTYLSMLNPTVLFVRGGPSLVTATGRSGFVLLPVAIFLIAGLAELWRRRDWTAWVIVSGIVLSLIPAALKGEPAMIQRAMYLLPFLALLAGYGFLRMWRARSVVMRAATILLLAAGPIQFAYFYFDYFTHYKFRSAFYYDPVNFRDVAGHLLGRAPAPAYYFGNDLDDASVKWRFYTLQQHRQELLARTSYIEPDARPNASRGSLLVTYVNAARLEALAADGWSIEQVISDVDQRPAAAILRKDQ